MVRMSPLEASLLNRSTDSNARCPLRSRLNDLNGHVSLALGQLPNLLGQDIKRDWSLVLWVLVHNELAELLLIRLSTRQVGHADLLDCHG
jgi:hypothetical protein